MAEYLCKEDMSTGEYISRDLALRQLNATCLATSCDNYNGARCRACAYADAMDFIEAIPASDVQPLSVVAKHIKSRLYETALNTNGAESDTIAAMAERIDFWINELRGGDTNG